MSTDELNTPPSSDPSATSRDASSNAPLRRLEALERLPFALIECDANLHVVGWNHSAEAMFGHPSSEALGKRLTELIDDPETAGSFPLWQDLLSDEAKGPLLREQHTRTGERIICSWIREPVRDDEGRPTSALFCGQDLTDRIRAANRYKQHEMLLRAIVKNLDVVAWALDEKGIFVYQEGKALASVGLSPGQFLGLSFLELYANQPEGLEPIKGVLAGQSVHTFTYAHDAHWENWVFPVEDELGRRMGAAAIALNITEQKRMEQDLRDRLEVIEKQQRVIRELATPIIEVWDQVLAVPMLGVVDSMRAADLMENLLAAVGERRARYAILDLTGVETVDTQTASHLINMIRALGLLGTEGIITGIHPIVAQTMVALGLDLKHIVTLATLRDGLARCMRQMRKSE